MARWWRSRRRCSRGAISRGGVGGAAQVATRFIGATALKWLLLIGGLYLALARFELPPLPLLSAFIAGLLAYLIALMFQVSGVVRELGSDKPAG